MGKRALGLMVLVALFVVAGKPQAQPIADDVVIPLPIIEDNGPHAEMLLAKANPSAGPVAGHASAAEPVIPVASPASPATQPIKAKPIESGTVQLSSTAFQVCYLLQRDTAADDHPALVSMVVWKAVGEGAKFEVDELRERISLHPWSPSPTQKGAYALQTDYQVRKLSLSQPDMTHLAELLLAGDGRALVADSLYKSKIAPNLREVEWSAERSKELRKLAAQKAREARRAKSSSAHAKSQIVKKAVASKAKPVAAKKKVRATHAPGKKGKVTKPLIAHR